jgi:hypothetical protein
MPRLIGEYVGSPVHCLVERYPDPHTGIEWVGSELEAVLGWDIGVVIMDAGDVGVDLVVAVHVGGVCSVQLVVRVDQPYLTVDQVPDRSIDRSDFTFYLQQNQ